MLTYGYVRNTGSQNLAISLLESHADGARLYNESHLPLEYTYKPALCCRTPVTLTAAAQPRLTLEARALGRNPTCCAFDGPPTASPEELALAIAGLVARTADDAMPANSADETGTYVHAIRPAIIGLIEMLGFHHREASVVAVRAVLLRLAHGVTLPTDVSAGDLMGINRRMFSRWIGRVSDSAGDDTLAGVVTNSCQKSHALKRRAEAATQPPPKRACTSGAGASNAPPPDSSPAEALAASACLVLAASASPEADLGRGSAPPSAPPSPPVTASQRSCDDQAPNCIS